MVRPDQLGDEPFAIMGWYEPASEEDEAEEFELLPEASEGAGDHSTDEVTAALSLPSAGADDPTVTLFECGAYSCFYTAKARETVDQLLATYPDLGFRWMHFPLEFDGRAGLMARAAVAAQNQGRFWQMHDALFDKDNVNEEADLIELAQAVGLDIAQFEADLSDPKTAQLVSDQRAWCQANGMTGTPAFFIDGEMLQGARPFESFAEVVQQALAEAEG